jgi:GDP-4-dehydro-6-deoxy-D-mannose reductase
VKGDAPKRLAITGASGFVGGHLVDFLRREAPEVALSGIVRPHGGAVAPPVSGLRLVEADLADPVGVSAALDELRPDAIVHLAGQSSPRQSWLDPGGTLRSNVLGIVHLVLGARRLGLTPTFLVVGSAEEYGEAASREPLTETTPLRPSSPYAVSKVAQGLLAVECGGSAGMRVVRTRTFHHTGPGRGEAFAESSFARQIAEIEAGLRPPVIHVGNLEAVRDFTDVRDVVRAYWGLVRQGLAGQVVNVCSGRGRPIRELLDILLGLARASVDIRVDPERLRPSDVPVLIGDPTLLRTTTGWKPEIPIERTLGDLLADWRSRVGVGVGAGLRAGAERP